ncbi:MAG: hypothetical protein Q4G69_03025 [Planctomycetia bacterium]|nr:hypothetical protein [Planctomycetia bacterium]
MSQQKSPFPDTRTISKMDSDSTGMDLNKNTSYEEGGDQFPRIVARMPDLGNRFSEKSLRKPSLRITMEWCGKLLEKIPVRMISKKTLLWSSAVILLLCASVGLWLTSSQDLPSGGITKEPAKFVVQLDNKELKGNESIQGLVPGIADSKDQASLHSSLAEPTLAKNQEPDILACLPKESISSVSTLDIPEYPGKNTPVESAKSAHSDKNDPQVQFPATFSQKATLPDWNDLAEMDKKTMNGSPERESLPAQTPIAQAETPVSGQALPNIPNTNPQNFGAAQIPSAGNVQGSGMPDPSMISNPVQNGNNAQYAQNPSYPVQPNPYQTPVNYQPQPNYPVQPNYQAQAAPVPSVPVMAPQYNVQNYAPSSGQINPQYAQNYQQVSYPGQMYPAQNSMPANYPQNNPSGYYTQPVPVSVNQNTPISNNTGNTVGNQNGEVYRIASAQTANAPADNGIANDSSYAETVKQNTKGRFQGYSINTESSSRKPTNYSSRDFGYNTNRNLW